MERRDRACVRVLACGCGCFGVRDEEKCPPCFKCELDIDGEYCSICGAETMKEAPCVYLGCSHAFHQHCILGRIKQGWMTARVMFNHITW